MNPISQKEIEIVLQLDKFPIKFKGFGIIELMGKPKTTYALISRENENFMFMYSADINAPLIFEHEKDCKRVIKHFKKINKIN